MSNASEEQLTNQSEIKQEAKPAESAKKRIFFPKRCRQCEDLKKESEEYKAGWQRALADYRNLQAEIERKKSDWIKLSEWQILTELIPIYENFKKAFAAEKNSDDNWVKGIEHIKKQLGDVLKSHGVEEIKTVGEKFDPASHEAVGQEEAADQAEGVVLKEVSGGYKLGEKVLLPARVIVSESREV